MNSNITNDTLLMERAIDRSNLVVRSEGNARYGTMNFDSWVDEILEKITFSRVLDICCGTGNQLIKYAARQNIKDLVGVDISQEALTRAQEKLLSILNASLFSLECTRMEEMFDNALGQKTFDLISCFYGLYYAQNVEHVVTNMIKYLDNNGRIIIVGPYGNNNSNLFRLLQRHFTISEFIIRSSTTFMESELFPILAQEMHVERKTFVNYIHYPTAQSLLEYWRSTTFYSPTHDAAITAEINNHFQHHNKFILEKHIMAYVAVKGL